MTHSELADILMEIEGQRRALAEKGYFLGAAELQAKLGKLCSEHITEIASGLKYWDVPLAITQEMIEEEFRKLGQKPPQPTNEAPNKVQ